MKVYFERTGGFAAIRKSLSLDVDSLSPEDSAKFRNIVKETNFFHLSSNAEIKSGADYFHYKVTLETKDGKHTVETTDLSMTPKFESLVNFLLDKAA